MVVGPMLAEDDAANGPMFGRMRHKTHNERSGLKSPPPTVQNGYVRKIVYAYFIAIAHTGVNILPSIPPRASERTRALLTRQSGDGHARVYVTLKACV